MPEVITKGDWVLFFVVAAVNAAIYNIKAKADIAAHPEKAASYPRLIRGYLFWMSLPWVAMGLVLFCRGAESIFEFFAPASMGWAVGAWHALVIGIWVSTAYWIYGRDGAEILANHRAFHHRTVRSANAFRLWTGLALAAGGIAEIVMWFGGMPRASLG